MPKYIVTVEFAVEREQDCDAETAVEYAIDHSPLFGKDNGITLVGNAIAAEAVDSGQRV